MDVQPYAVARGKIGWLTGMEIPLLILLGFGRPGNNGEPKPGHHSLICVVTEQVQRFSDFLASFRRLPDLFLPLGPHYIEKNVEKETTMNRIRFKTWIIAVVCLVPAMLAAACSGSDSPSLFADQEATLKVLHYDESQFFREYGELLYAKYPHLEIEVVSTNSLYPSNPEPDFDYQEAFNRFVEERNPDLLMLAEYQYQEFYEHGRLLNLEPKIEADGYDIETIASGVIDLLRERAGGQLHGLAPSFNSQALFYNPALFDQYGIPHPTDHMTWEEVFELARQFPTGGIERGPHLRHQF